MCYGALFKKGKRGQGAKIHTFGYSNFGIFAPGAVPRSSALCLFIYYVFLLLDRSLIMG